MPCASTTLFKENIDALTLLAIQGYKTRITGESLGGGVAALMGASVKKWQAKDNNPGGIAMKQNTFLKNKSALLKSVTKPVRVAMKKHNGNSRTVGILLNIKIYYKYMAVEHHSV
eukprot:8639030-Ditylum_brightwellii.AAC.1